MGGEFLEVPGFKLEEGSVYAKEMSPEFVAAEMKLFEQQCKEVDVVITTALIPGRPAPKLIKKYMVDQMRSGSVIVDLAAETGGNVETTKPNEIYNYNGVTHVGVTDFPSRLPTQASTLFSNNVTSLLLDMAPKGYHGVNLANDVTRGSIVMNKGEILAALPPATTAKAAAKPKKLEPPPPVDPFTATMRNSLTVTGTLGTLMALGVASPSPAFTTMVSTFSLAGIVGYNVVWGVVPALHSPLMSVTNAISGTTAIGGLSLMGGGVLPVTSAQWLANIAVLVSSVNIMGGFLVTQRMLDMFKRPQDPPEYNYLFGIPAASVVGGFVIVSASVCVWARRSPGRSPVKDLS